MSITTEEQRLNSHIDTDIFGAMLKLVKLVDWNNHEGVKIMVSKGWSYYYDDGIVDKTPHYTRYEEDRIRFTNDKYIIQINLSSGGVVLQDKSHSDQYYMYPTLFVGLAEIRAISLIQEDIDALRKSARETLSKKR